MQLRVLHRQRALRGITLLEMLLTVVLVLGLASAVIYNFSSFQRGSQLEEGAGQFETLFRFARAQAASSGRLVRIEFVEADSGTAESDLTRSNVRITYEADPVGAPGVFQEVSEAASFVQSINDSVSVLEVRFETNNGPPPTATAEAPPAEAPADNPAEAAAMSPVKFYPDGTADSVHVVLASRAEEDQRRYSVRMVGVTGSIRRQLVADAAAAESAPAAPAAAAAAEAGK